LARRGLKIDKSSICTETSCRQIAEVGYIPSLTTYIITVLYGEKEVYNVKLPNNRTAGKGHFR
jgi:hypothetical protein